MEDLYDILNISKKASAAEIKTAFRTLAKKNHPDLHPGDKKTEQQFKKINSAYKLLSDPEKRKKYDEKEIDANLFFNS